jgi:hypothetical protein
VNQEVLLMLSDRCRLLRHRDACRRRLRDLRAAGRWDRAAVVFTAGVMVLACPAAAYAADLGVNDIPTTVNSLRNWIIGILAGVATLFLTIGGLRYLLAGGDPGEVEKAKSALKCAAIGYALALLAPVVVAVLKSVVGA